MSFQEKDAGMRRIERETIANPCRQWVKPVCKITGKSELKDYVNAAARSSYCPGDGR